MIDLLKYGVILYPKIISEHKSEDSNALVIIRTSDGSANISRHDTNEGSGEETSALTPQLLGEQVCSNGGKAAKEGRQEDANLSNVHGDVKRVEYPVDGARRDHEARVDRAADDAPQWVPGALVEPVEEVVEAVRHHVIGRAVVEPRVELVNDALVADHREETRHECGYPHACQRCYH